MLSSIAFVLMLLNFPFPGLPDYLKIDFSDVPAIIAILVYGPAAGIAVEAIKIFCSISFKEAWPACLSGRQPILSRERCLFCRQRLCLKAQFCKRSCSEPAGRNRGDDRADEYFELYSYPARVYLVLHSPALSNSQLKTAVVAGILPFNIVKALSSPSYLRSSLRS